MASISFPPHAFQMKSAHLLADNLVTLLHHFSKTIIWGTVHITVTNWMYFMLKTNQALMC